MKSVEKLNKLADKVEAKLSKYGQDAPQTQEQPSTTTLFFGEGNAQQQFAAAVQSGSPLEKFLTDLATKTQKSTAFDLKITANPKKGAAWLLSVTPPAAKGQVSKLLDVEYQKLMKTTMAAAQAAADQKAKAGGGTGTNNVASLNLDMD